MKLIIKNGRVIDPANNIDGDHDIVIDKGIIQSVTPAGKGKDDASAKVIDAKGCIVAPGFMDMHKHAHPFTQRPARIGKLEFDLAEGGGIRRPPGRRVSAARRNAYGESGGRRKKPAPAGTRLHPREST